MATTRDADEAELESDYADAQDADGFADAGPDGEPIADDGGRAISGTRAFQELNRKVAAVDASNSWMFTALIFGSMMVLSYAVAYAFNVEKWKVKAEGGVVEMVPPNEDEEEGKFGHALDVGDMPEEMPNRDENLSDQAPPDLTQDLLQMIQTMDFQDPNQTKPAPGGTQGAGGGTGNKGNGLGSGVVPRYQRWVVNYDPEQVAQYARKLDFFKIEIGVVRGGTAVFVSNFSGNPVKKAGGGDDRLFFQATDAPRREADRNLLRRASVDSTGAILAHFYSKQLEGQLLALELKHQGKTEKEIRRTTFAIKSAGDGYEFFVVNQELN